MYRPSSDSDSKKPTVTNILRQLDQINYGLRMRLHPGIIDSFVGWEWEGFLLP